MKVTRSKASAISAITIDEDLDFTSTYQVKALASPASGEALRKGNKDITNAEIADAANIAISKLASTPILRTLLTTQGDMIVRGATLPARFAKPATGKILKATATGYEGVDETKQVAIGATVAHFQANIGTGTAADDDQINDNAGGGYTQKCDNTGEYTIVNYDRVVTIKRWRQSGSVSNTGDGRFKIQYFDLATQAYVDWVTDIPVRTTDDWTTMANATEVITDKIKVICTTVDGGGTSYIGELEVIY